MMIEHEFSGGVVGGGIECEVGDALEQVGIVDVAEGLGHGGAGVKVDARRVPDGVGVRGIEPRLVAGTHLGIVVHVPAPATLPDQRPAVSIIAGHRSSSRLT